MTQSIKTQSIKEPEFISVSKQVTAPVLYEWQKADFIKLWSLYQTRTHLPHAILLYGMQGLGVEEFSAFWVKSILCETPSNNCACNTCKSCVLIATNSHPDLFNLALSVDSESKSKAINVDMVREVIEFLSLSPHLGEHKIVFIPDMSLLNLSSSNALLKILEEPPQYAIFVMATTNLSQLLPTIKSRCYKYMMSRPSIMDQAFSQSLNQSQIIQNELSIVNATNIDNESLGKFWLAYYDYCPLYEIPITNDELLLFISTLVTPSIDNIFELTKIIDGKIVTFSFVVDFLQKWLSDVALYKITNQLNYFVYFKNYIAQIMPNLQINKVFYLNDRLSFMQKWVNHPLAYKLQIENIMLQYQQLFVKEN